MYHLYFQEFVKIFFVARHIIDFCACPAGVGFKNTWRQEEGVLSILKWGSVLAPQRLCCQAPDKLQAEPLS